MNDPQPMPTDAEREQFEEMMRRETFEDLSRVSDGSYKSYEARVGWIAWQAARRTPAPLGVEPMAWRNVLPGGKLTDQWESARVSDYNQGWNDYRKSAKEVLEKVLAMGRVPPGWKLVPVEPDSAMCKAARAVPDAVPPYPPHFHLIWDAMLAAAPSIKQGGQHGAE